MIVNGHWGKWSPWSTCPLIIECKGVSRSTRTRVCDNPPSANGGQPCPTDIDDDIQSQTCNDGVKVCIPDTNCLFDFQPCKGWDFGEWTLRSGKTPSRGTGPTVDKTSSVIPALGRVYSTVEPRNSGHHWCSKEVSATARCLQ